MKIVQVDRKALEVVWPLVKTRVTQSLVVMEQPMTIVGFEEKVIRQDIILWLVIDEADSSLKGVFATATGEILGRRVLQVIAVGGAQLATWIEEVKVKLRDLAKQENAKHIVVVGSQALATTMAPFGFVPTFVITELALS